MCGVTALLGATPRDDIERQELRAMVVQMSKLVSHRGPDWSGVHAQQVDRFFNVLGHERLAIVDPVGGAQPLTNADNTVALSVNGEIYNHTAIRKQLAGRTYKTGSDCEAILHLYEELKDGVQMENALDGPHVYVLSDKRSGEVVAARDPIGINPLYWGHRKRDDTVWFASELKALHPFVDDFWEFPPGCVTKFATGSGKKGVLDGLKRHYQPQWWDNEYLPTTPLDLKVLRGALVDAVRKRLMSDVPFGVLLSGGLDSSLVASIVAKEFKAGNLRKHDNPFLSLDRLHSFTIGLKAEAGPSPDILCAREVAKFIDTVHHEFEYTLEEGLDAVPSAIRAMESYDVTTIRSGTPMYLLSRRIKAMGIKMVMSGEGADEIFGGYLYFHKAPNGSEFHKETVRKVKALHSYDVLRANKSPAAVGLEVRVPFLDKNLLEVVMNMDPEEKMVRADQGGSNEKPKGGPMEKHCLRAAFDVPDDPYLPSSVLWRQKEQFSDGVGYGWIDSLKAHAESIVSDEDMRNVHAEFAYNTPTTKEALWYRRLFESFFPGKSAVLTLPDDLASTVACSTAKALEWDEAFKHFKDPSGLAVASVHLEKKRRLN